MKTGVLCTGSVPTTCVGTDPVHKTPLLKVAVSLVPEVLDVDHAPTGLEIGSHGLAKVGV